MYPLARLIHEITINQASIDLPSSNDNDETIKKGSPTIKDDIWTGKNAIMASNIIA